MASSEFEKELERRNSLSEFERELDRREAISISTIDSEPGTYSAMAAEGARRVGDIVLEAPQIAGDTLAAAASVPAFIKGLWPGGKGPGEAFGEQFAIEQQRNPSAALRAIDLPDVNQTMAGAMSLPSFIPGGESPKESFQRHLSDIDIQELKNESEFPFATALSEGGADLGALLLAKKPVQSRILRSEKALSQKHAPLGFGKYAERVAELAAKDPKVIAAAKDYLSSPTSRAIYRGAGRAAETAAETTFLEILSGDNPGASAGFAFGSQIGGSLSLTALKGLGGSGISDFSLRMLAAGGGAMAIWQLAKESTPGGEDRIVESAQQGFAKVAMVIGIGLLSGLVGSGRLRNNENSILQNRMPEFADAINTIHRGTFESLLIAAKDGTPEQQAQIEGTLKTLASNPESFDKKTKDALYQAIQDGSIVERIGELSNNRDFQSAIFSTNPPDFSLDDDSWTPDKVFPINRNKDEQ